MTTLTPATDWIPLAGLLTMLMLHLTTNAAVTIVVAAVRLARYLTRKETP